MGVDMAVNHSVFRVLLLKEIFSLVVLIYNTATAI